MPACVLDTFIEFRRLTNKFLPRGTPQQKAGLLAVLDKFGLPHISEAEKDRHRQRIMQGPPFYPREQREELSYCATDVDASGATASMHAAGHPPRASLLSRSQHEGGSRTLSPWHSL